MDVYGGSAPEVFRIDDLLDFSNEEIFSSGSSSKTTDFDLNHQYQPHQLHTDNNAAASYYDALVPNSADFTDKLCVPSDDVAELEWLSNFVEDSSSDYPSNSLTGTINLNSNNTTLHSKSRSKRSRATTANTSWTTSLQQAHKPIHEKSNQDPQNNNNNTMMIKIKKESSVNSRERSCQMPDIPRKCTHCASEKTPQWRTGPLGPKTLCNACGVRFKSGRLVPEYRPAASPTFVLTQHSNSHRKVMELRRQKGVVHQQQHQPPQQQGMYGHHFQVC